METLNNTFTNWFANAKINFDLDAELLKNRQTTLSGFIEIAKIKLSVKIKNALLNNCSGLMVEEESFNYALNDLSIRNAIRDYGFIFGMSKTDCENISNIFKKKAMINETDTIKSSDMLIMILSNLIVNDMVLISLSNSFKK
jgi:hypothetical protein